MLGTGGQGPNTYFSCDTHVSANGLGQAPSPLPVPRTPWNFNAPVSPKAGVCSSREVWALAGWHTGMNSRGGGHVGHVSPPSSPEAVGARVPLWQPPSKAGSFPSPGPSLPRVPPAPRPAACAQIPGSRFAVGTETLPALGRGASGQRGPAVRSTACEVLAEGAREQAATAPGQLHAA